MCVSCYSFTVFLSVFIREVLVKRPFIASSDAVKLIKAGICVQPVGTTEIKYLPNTRPTNPISFILSCRISFSGWFSTSSSCTDERYCQSSPGILYMSNKCSTCLWDNENCSGRDRVYVNLISSNCQWSYQQQHQCNALFEKYFFSVQSAENTSEETGKKKG